MPVRVETVCVLRKIKRFISWKKYLYTKKYKSDTWYFILSYGIGDAYLISSLLSKFIEQSGKVVIILEKENQSFIPELFLDNTEILINQLLPYELIHEFGKFNPGEPIYLSPLHLYDKKLLLMLGYNNLTLIDVYKIILGLNLSTKPNKPNFLTTTNYNIKEYFIKYSLLVGKTVLICPQANSIELLNDKFWIDLADNIKRIGLVPVFMNNVNNNYININFPLEHSKEFCDLAGYVVSLRSGFCDLIATSVAKKIILHPDTMYYGGKLVDGTSLVAMGIAEKEGILELEVSTNNTNYILIIDKIMNFIND